MNLDEKLAKIYEIPFPAVILKVIFTLTILIKFSILGHSLSKCSVHQR
jgi:hypothetical protein